MTSGPTISRHRSQQVVATPWEFIRAVERKFGPIAVDLAATDDNAKARCYITPEQDTFKQDWAKVLDGGLGWLNPEFDPMTKWVRYCAEQQQRGATFLHLGPASIGANWFWDYVQPYATVYSVGRIDFEGIHEVWPKTHPKAGQWKCLERNPDCKGCSAYPKDLILSHYSQSISHVLQRWRWQQ